jgi:heme-degrading monooxygenase HmoA
MKIRFALHVRLKPGQEDTFLRHYGAIRDRVALGVRGNLSHQACQSQEEPLSWIITSEWEDLDSCLEWERSEEHRALVTPLRDCWDEAKLVRYAIRAEVDRRPGA